MWVLFALGSALFAGLTSVLAKCGNAVTVLLDSRRVVAAVTVAPQELLPMLPLGLFDDLSGALKHTLEHFLFLNIKHLRAGSLYLIVEYLHAVKRLLCLRTVDICAELLLFVLAAFLGSFLLKLVEVIQPPLEDVQCVPLAVGETFDIDLTCRNRKHLTVRKRGSALLVLGVVYAV